MANSGCGLFLSPCGFFVLATLLFCVGIWILIRKPTKEGFEDESNGSADYTLIMYHSPKCGYCRNAMPEFKQLGDQQVISGKSVNIMTVNPKTERDKILGGPRVRAYPTIRLYGPGNIVIEDYKGDRTQDGFLNFLKSYVK